MDRVFLEWGKRGLKCIEDLYIDDKFMSFLQLQEKFQLPQSHFFRYLQIRNFVQQNFSDFPLKPQSHTYFDIIRKADFKHLISQFVKCFTIPVDSDRIKKTWAEDLGVPLSEDQWSNCLSNIQKGSNARYKLIQFKVIHRLHFSKLKLNRIYNSVSPLCDRCNIGEGSLAHLFWHCPVLNAFWSQIFM